MNGRTAQLQEFCRVVQGGKLKLSGHDFVAEGYPAYGAGGINGYLPTYEYDAPAVVLSAIGARCGKCFHAEGKWTSLANTQLIFPDPDCADTKFLWYQLNDEQRWHRSGTGQPFIKPSDVKAHRVFLPPLPEQRRIADILDKADALRAKRRAALAKLDTLTQSIFLDMFGDPVTNPKGWPVRCFREVCETRLGKMLDQKQQTGEHLRPYLRNANVQWFHFDLSNVQQMDFDARDRRILRLQPGDLLICEGGEPGRAAVWRGEMEECYFQKALHRARPDHRLAVSEYLVWLLWFLVQRGRLSGVTSATIAHLTGEKLAVLPTVLPPLELQIEFAQRVAAVGAIRRAFQLAESFTASMFAALQQRAFRGEL